MDWIVTEFEILAFLLLILLLLLEIKMDEYDTRKVRRMSRDGR